MSTIAPRQDSFAELASQPDPYLARMMGALARKRRLHDAGDCDFETCPMCSKDRAEVYASRAARLSREATAFLRDPVAQQAARVTKRDHDINSRLNKLLATVGVTHG
jgi:hypothetical protein